MTSNFFQVGSEPVRADLRATENTMKFSICTLVTRPAEYDELRRSYISNGFGAADCEFLYIDNSVENALDAFAGYNTFLATALGRYIILCHQDILLLSDDRFVLERRMAELDKLDSKWALCGNAGGAGVGRRYARITDPHGSDQSRGPFPVQVCSLDENFIVVRRDANLAVSHDLEGFHLYGTDLCIIAHVLGRSAWVIDFHLEHKSAGIPPDEFFAVRAQMIRKYRRAFRTRWITTACTHMLVSGLPIFGKLLPVSALRRLRQIRTRFLEKVYFSRRDLLS